MSTSKVSMISGADLTSLSQGEDILIINERSPGSLDVSDMTTELKNAVVRGIPIITLSDSSDLISGIADELQISYSFALGGTAYGLKYDPMSGISYALCIGAEHVTAKPMPKTLKMRTIGGLTSSRTKLGRMSP